MEYLIMYGLFALTTAIAGTLELCGPLLKEFDRGPGKEHPYLLVFVFFIGAILIAPLLLIPTIIPSQGEAFRNKFHQIMNS